MSQQHSSNAKGKRPHPATFFPAIVEFLKRGDDDLARLKFQCALEEQFALGRARGLDDAGGVAVNEEQEVSEVLPPNVFRLERPGSVAADTTPDELLASLANRTPAKVAQALECAEVALREQLRALLEGFRYRDNLASPRAIWARVAAVALERVRSALQGLGSAPRLRSIATPKNDDDDAERAATVTVVWTTGGGELALAERDGERRVLLRSLGVALALPPKVQHEVEAQMRAVWNIATWRVQFPDGRIAAEDTLPLEWFDAYLWRLDDPVDVGSRALLMMVRLGWRRELARGGFV